MSGLVDTSVTTADAEDLRELPTRAMMGWREIEGHPHQVGDRSKRDPAYHQGTVWPFLLGPFLGTWVRLHGGTDATRREALGFLDALAASVDASGCVGHLSEIFDAEPPHAGSGCFARGWSAGELLFSIREHLMPLTDGAGTAPNAYPWLPNVPPPSEKAQCA